MPLSDTFRTTLDTRLEAIAAHFGTPFHIYDAAGIQGTAADLYSAFKKHDYREYFAVKALPNPAVLRLLAEAGCGFDCSSVPELILARRAGVTGDRIMFTSNNTTASEFAAAIDEGGCILNLDDAALMDKLPTLPDLISFRLNPGIDAGNAIIGKPQEAKFGIPREKIVAAYREAQASGIRRFGLHMMALSNACDAAALLGGVEVLCTVAGELRDKLGIPLEFINIGGGLGIPYHPDETPLNLKTLADGLERLWQSYQLEGTRLYTESGRYVTGPHGALVTRVINTKQSYRDYIGVDASMSALMRPGMYGAYHHMHVHGKTDDAPTAIVDVVGALCENNDKFAIQRELPIITEGDLLVIHDTGAHGHAMGFNYNGRLRPQELLLHPDGRVECIRRAETIDDYFATLNFPPDVLAAS